MKVETSYATTQFNPISITLTMETPEEFHKLAEFLKMDITVPGAVSRALTDHPGACKFSAEEMNKFVDGLMVTAINELRALPEYSALTRRSA